MDKVNDEAVQQPEIQTATVPVELLNVVLEYLGSRPYREVAQIVEAIKENSEINQ